MPTANAKNPPVDPAARFPASTGQIKKGVRYSQSDFPFGGKFAVPALDNDAARAGTIDPDYSSMGPVPDTKFGKNLRKNKKG
jgi:hypothetical protein